MYVARKKNPNTNCIQNWINSVTNFFVTPILSMFVAKLAAKNTFNNMKKGLLGDEEEEQQVEERPPSPPKQITPAREKRRFPNN